MSNTDTGKVITGLAKRETKGKLLISRYRRIKGLCLFNRTGSRVVKSS